MTTPAFAEGMEYARKGGCTNCHAVDRKVVGPSYKDVAAKYKGDAKARTKLFNKVLKGGSGVWGKMRMPANRGKLTDQEFKDIVDRILSLK